MSKATGSGRSPKSERQAKSGTRDRRSKGNGSIDASGPSLERIFEGTLSALWRRGAKQLSMTDVCEASGLSRATLYRYFSRKDDLLAALSEYVTNNFVEGVRDAAAQHDEAPEKLRAVLQFLIAYTRKIKSDRILEVEPELLLKSLHAQFSRHLVAVRAALEPVFEAFEARSGFCVDRALISELLLRAQESTSLIPAGMLWNSLPDVLANFAKRYLAPAGRVAVQRKTRRPSAAATRLLPQS